MEPKEPPSKFRSPAKAIPPTTFAFPPKHLADAFQIGEKHSLNPGMTTSPSGDYWVVMNIRYAIAPAQQATTPIAA